MANLAKGMLSSFRLLKHKAFIGGRWRDAVNGKVFNILNPSNQKIIGSVPNMGKEDVDLVVQEAVLAQEPWGRLTAKVGR